MRVVFRTEVCNVIVHICHRLSESAVVLSAFVFLMFSMEDFLLCQYLSLSNKQVEMRTLEFPIGNVSLIDLYSVTGIPSSY